jgi:S1-C subfamily serine protease
LAAEQGHNIAQYNLGLIYDRGDGVPQDYKEAVKWYRLAAAQGYADAQFNLGVMYAKGEGVAENYVQAYKWFNLAAAQGVKAATKNRNILRDKMSPSQIAEAQRLSSEYRPRQQDSSQTKPQPYLHAPETATVRSSGTGFFITEDGFLLTAYHIVKDANRIQVWTGQRYSPTRIVHTDTINDVALLKVDSHVSALPLAPSRGVRTGQEVYTLGFPNLQLQGKEVKYTQGHVNSLSGIADDPRLFQISLPIQPGNSGGPLLDTMGQVVGLVVAKLDELYAAVVTGSLPQNVNYALKSSFVLSFLEAYPEVSNNLVGIKNEGLSKRQIIEKSSKAVGIVLCY